MDLLFADEQMAIETLGSNFDRLANSMERIANTPALKNQSQPVRAVELGGGTGVITMYLLACGRCVFCEVIDRAAQPLAIGKRWAANLGLANISFRQASYADLQASGSPDFDFAFAEHALDLDLDSENRLNPLELPKTPVLPAAYSQLVEAMHRVLKPNGSGLIGSGTATPSALAALCAALRTNKLAIDWRLTSNRDGLQLYVRPNALIVIDSSEDEALAIVADVAEHRKVPPPEGRSLQKIFRTGTKYLEVRSECKDVKFICSIFQVAGLACLFQWNSEGCEGATVFSAARLVSWANDALRDAKSREISHRFVDARLSPLLEP